MNRTGATGFVKLDLIFVFLFLLALGGWIANLVKVFSTMSEPLTGMFILRVIGVVAGPLGAILGYF